MKRLFIFWTMSFMGISLIAQENFSYKLPREAADVIVNSDSTYLVLFFANLKDEKDKTAQIGVFDLKSRDLIYQSSVFPREKDGFRVLSHGILMSSRKFKTISMIDWSGHQVWKEENYYGFFYKKEADLGLVMRKTLSDAGTPTLGLKAFSLSTGQILWRENRGYDFAGYMRGIHQIDKSSVLLLSDNIYKYGLNDGFLAEHKYKTSPQGANVSVVVSDNKVYLTEWKKLTCLSSDLESVWSESHPSLARNELKDEGDRLRLINYGYVKSDAILFPTRHLNKPYIAYYDKQSGQQLSIKYLEWKKQDGLIEKICSDTILYVKSGDVFQQLRVPKNEYVAIVDKGDVYSLNNDLNITGKYADHDVYYQLFVSNDVTCVGRKCPDGNDFYLLSSDGRSIFHLPEGTTDVCRIGQQLFYTVSDELWCVPICGPWKIEH